MLPHNALLRIVPVLTPALALATPAGAAQQARVIETDRPSFTESAATVGAGHVQLEGGYTLARIAGSTGHTLGELLVRVGLGSDVELRVGLDSYAWSRGPAGPRSGFTDTSLGLKFRLADGEPGRARPAFGLVVASTLPTGNNTFGEPRAQPEAKLAANWDLTRRVGLQSNLNYAYILDDDDRVHRLATSVVLGYDWTDRIGTYFEGYGFLPRNVDRDDVAYINGGVTYLVSPLFQLDLRLGVRVADPDDRFAGIGLAYRW